MYNRAKLVFSTNRIPSLSRDAQEDQGAFYSRWIIVPYDKSFLGKEDSNLRTKLTTPEELSGVLNWSLEGLKRLRDNNWQFTSNVDSASLYRRASDPLVAFLEDCCEPFDGYVIKDDLVTAYNDYAKKNGLPPASSKKSFGQYMKDQTIIPVSEYFPSVKDRRPEAWYGIRLKK
jgi:putative DNA primase/helicase